eukprot:1161110-Pelagomonas_calceolata.AAC.11
MKAWSKSRVRRLIGLFRDLKDEVQGLLLYLRHPNGDLQHLCAQTEHGIVMSSLLVDSCLLCI